LFDWVVPGSEGNQFVESCVMFGERAKRLGSGPALADFFPCLSQLIVEQGGQALSL
jgi:hypothetical protein